jgi:outer membrane autotransporter protein
LTGVISGWFGKILRVCVFLVGAYASCCIGAASPALADCIQSGTTVVCSGASPNGFNAGVQDGLTVNVQPGAIVGNGTTNNIGLNDNNTVTNLGSIGVGDGTVAISGGVGNTVVTSGTIAAGDGGAGVTLGGGSVLNSGTITVGAGGGGIAGTTVINTGQIQVGDGSNGLVGVADFSVITNSGAVVAGDSGNGIGVTTNSNTILNSGSITFGGCGAGIMASGTGNTITNTGTLRESACGGGGGGIGIMAGDANTVANSGTITVGDVGQGIIGGAGTTVVNTGRIVAGASGTGIFSGGNITNSGTIVIGESFLPFSGGIVGFADGLRLANSGTIVGGTGTVAVVISGNNGVLINSGSIAVGDFGGGLVSLGDGGSLSNSGTIVAGDNGFGILSQGSSATVLNSGTIRVGACGIGIDTSGGSGSAIVNSGRIIGIGCSASGVAMGNGDTLANSGTISAPFSLTSLGTATVTNTGMLDGAIALGGPASLLTNSGLLTVSGPLVAGAAVAHAIDGTFTQTRAGTLGLRVLPGGGAGNYDTLAVTGVANLGGTLRPVAQPGLYGPTTTYAGVLTFASSTGRFDTVAPASLFLASSAVYNGTSVDLMLTRLPFNNAGGAGSSGNGRAIGNVLEANYSTSLTGALASFYGNLLVSTAPNTLAQLTGEVTTAPVSASFAGFGQFLGTIFGQTATSRTTGQATAGGPPALARSTTTGGGTRMALAFAEDCSSDFCDTTPRKVTAWAQGFGGAGSIDGNGTVGSSRVDLNSAGGALGVDMRLTPNLIAGVTMGTTSAGFGLTDIASSGTARAIVLGLYGGYTEGPLYVDAALAYGYNTFNTTRSINTGALSEVAYGAFDGHQYGGRIEGGWRFGIDRHALTPFAGLTVQALSQSGYTETSQNAATGGPGVLGVTVQGQTTTSLRSALGLQFETAIEAGDAGVLKPRLRLGWAHEFNTNRSATVALSLLPGAPFQVTGAQPAADSLLIGAGFELELGRTVRVYGQFDGDVASNARAFSGTGGIRLVW